MNNLIKKKYHSMEKEQILELVRIGFCQPKFYKRSAWLNAKSIMEDILIPRGLAYAHDFGHGKGKFSSDGMSIKEIAEMAYIIINMQRKKLENK